MVDNNNFIMRLTDFNAKLKEMKIANVVLNDNLSLRYFLGLKIISDFYLFITNSDEINIKSKDLETSSSNDSSNASDSFGTLLVPRLEYEQVKDHLEGFPMGVLAFDNKFKLSDAFNKLSEQYKIDEHVTGLSFNSLTLSKFEDLRNNKLFRGTSINKDKPNIDKKSNYSLIDSDLIKNASPIIDGMRDLKYPDEIENIRKAAKISDKAIQKGIESLRDGITESEISAIIEYEMMKLGSEDRSFDTIVASGSNSWYPHAIHTDKKIKDGEIVTIDMGAVYQGYHSDITRTVMVGNGPYNKELINIINTVNDAQKEAIKLLKPGQKCHEIDAAARKFLKKKDLDKYFIHGLGHGVGLDVHDPVPRLAPNIEYKLKPGMIVTVEPGIYIPGVGGARTEDLFLITEDGYEYLSHTPVKYY